MADTPVAWGVRPLRLAAAPEADIVIGPWLEDLIRQYRTQPLAPRRRRRVALLLAALVSVGAFLAPTLLRRYDAAYPSDPQKQHALELCSRADPTFVRFLASERAACYRRIPGLLAHTRLTLQ